MMTPSLFNDFRLGYLLIRLSDKLESLKYFFKKNLSFYHKARLALLYERIAKTGYPTKGSSRVRYNLPNPLCEFWL